MRTGSWGYLRDSFSAYYYNELGVKVYTTTDYINGHKTNYTYTNSSTSDAGFMGGSLGCQIWYPTTWEQMTLNFSFNYKPVYGTYTVKETVFPTTYRSYGQTEWTVTVGASNNGKASFSVVNELIPGNIKIVKSSEDNKISGFEFSKFII